MPEQPALCSMTAEQIGWADTAPVLQELAKKCALDLVGSMGTYRSLNGLNSLRYLRELPMS